MCLIFRVYGIAAKGSRFHERFLKGYTIFQDSFKPLALGLYELHKYSQVSVMVVSSIACGWVAHFYSDMQKFPHSAPSMHVQFTAM